ncbi:disintegrin and metalloproteinase domain-containing protein unc-71-like isoform X1 [Haliotis rufescens]|uniref:disintegrin and metalloproteinase domain-containing protein unc-71-like isoform X1 n=1 Tax=Haliotis rufescens TaxID=6454 RepID=UPI00201E9378|nr:disintegrin and metalloproteinase domain-containing protein unc-71-like isoform X1 [Haliotis rufescens]
MHNSIGLLTLVLCWCYVHQGYAATYARDIPGLLSEYEFNRIMVNSVPKPYLYVYPKQLRDKRVVGISTKEHKVRHHGTHEHFKHVTLLLTLDNKRYKIKLERNDALFSSGIMVKHYAETNQQVITQNIEHCFYHGYVKRDEWSSVAVSTCSGIRGVIQMHNETFVIQPLLGGDEGMEHPHIVFKASVSHKENCGNSLGQWLPFHELHKGEFVRKLKYLRAVRYRREAAPQPPKSLKLAMVLDKAVYLGLNFSQTEMTTYAVEIANIADLYYRQLNMNLSLTYLEYWNLADQFIVSPKLREMLIKFMNFKKVALQGANFDIAYFMTGIELEGNAVGIALPDSVCTDRAVGISKNPKPFEPQQAATILAHMIGHNLGIEHDEDAKWREIYHEGGCECNDEFGCIMSTQVLAAGGHHSRMFSNCSKSDLDISLSMEITSCLDGKPPVNFPQTCGNSIVERGEECDCGSEEDCLKKDPCCDPDTCLLRYWAQCRSGPCCSNCTVLPRTHMCRDRQTECDVPEFCDGERGECPSNNYVQDGHPCMNSTGYCVAGICPSLQQQCQTIWGPDAKGGDDQCFERFNPTGNFNGHCGKDDTTGNYAKCSSEDILCGLLHCDGGNKEPLFGSDKGFSKTTVNSKGIEYECKIVHGPTMMDMPHMGLVQDGTKCGEGKVCHNAQCQRIKHLPPLGCPGTSRAVICSGHGVCTRDDTCFCDNGWGGYDCLIKLNMSMTTMMPATTSSLISSATTKGIQVIPLNPAENRLATTPADPSAAPVLKEMDGLSTMWLIIILASVVGGLVLVLSLTLFCYRRRTPSKLQSAVTKGLLGSKDGGMDKKKAGFVNAKYIGLGGVLPSYRPDALFGKKKKRMSSEDESDIGELPPPPIIISDPNSARPEKGILKNSMMRLTGEDNRRSSDSNGDQESVGPYMYDEDDDLEAEEIREILGEDDFEQSLDALDQLPESSSFDFVLPQPPHPSFGMPCLHPSPPPPRRLGRLDLPLSTDYQHQPLLWKGTGYPISPPRSKIVRLRNLDELIRQIDKNTIDLSPSPDEPPVQISPSTCTSEDVRSSETEPERHYHSAHSQSDHSPTSFTSSSTRDTARPILGNLSQYLLKRNDFNTVDHQNCDDNELQPHQIDIPPPMNPLNLRNIFNIGQPPLNRDNDTPLGSQTGENSSLNGTSNSRNGYEKSSGYGSEHDAERFSIEDISRSQSRSQSASPPSYSAVIRTGPNQIKLVPAGHRVVDGNHQDLHKILDGLPRIDAGTFERSPIQTSSANTPSTGPIPASKVLREQMDLASTPSTGPIPVSRTLRDYALESGNKPCIDRSLEEIPQDFSVDMKNTKKHHRKSLIKSKRPVSLSVSKHSSDSSSQETVNEGVRVA